LIKTLIKKIKEKDHLG